MVAGRPISIIMWMTQMATAIHKRMVASGKRSTVQSCEPMATIIERYGVGVQLESFADRRGMKLWDEQQRTVGFYQVKSTSGHLVSMEECFTDVLILASDAMVLGWVLRDQVTESEGAFSVYAEQIRILPDRFDFARTCAHLSEFGGIYDQDKRAWICFGCDEPLQAVLG